MPCRSRIASTVEAASRTTSLDSSRGSATGRLRHTSPAKGWSKAFGQVSEKIVEPAQRRSTICD